MARHKLLAAAAAVAIATSWGAVAEAATSPEEVSAVLAQMQRQLTDQEQRLETQEKLLSAQKARIAEQDAQIAQLRALTDVALSTARGAGSPGVATPAVAVVAEPGAPISTAPPPIQLAQASPVMGSPPAPVGEAPPQQERVVVASVPEGQGVLTPRGHFYVEPQFDYTHGSTNRLVFRGIVLVNAIQIGLIDASNADRNALSLAIDAKYGLTNRIEVEARVPYVWRVDRTLTLSQQDKTITQEMNLRGSDLGDVEFSGRYQLNSGEGAWPIFIAGARVKSDTGTNPYTIDRDEFGVATKLATGSGFWGLEGSLTFLYPSDPVVIFGGISYFDQFAKDINKEIDGVLVGRVNPGDSISANAGFGFALNPKFSFSLGYKHTYIFSTSTALGDTIQHSDSLQVGQFNFGWSFQISDRITITNNYSIGTTRDAPDMEVVFRLPIRF